MTIQYSDLRMMLKDLYGSSSLKKEMKGADGVSVGDTFKKHIFGTMIMREYTVLGFQDYRLRMLAVDYEVHSPETDEESEPTVILQEVGGTKYYAWSVTETIQAMRMWHEWQEKATGAEYGW